MTYATTTIQDSRPSIHKALSAVGAWFMRVGKAVFISRGMEARVQLIDELQALTDAELAQRGLRRDDIPAYVFRDILYL